MRLTTWYAVFLAVIAVGCIVVFRPVSGLSALALNLLAGYTLATAFVLWRRYPPGPLMFAILAVGIIILAAIPLLFHGFAWSLMLGVLGGLVALPGYAFLRDDLKPAQPAAPASSQPQIKITEDCRPLRDFYPDDEQRQQVHYTFAHKFLPWYVYRHPFGVFAPTVEEDFNATRWLQARWCMMEDNFGFAQRSLPNMVFRRVEELSASVERADGHPVLLVKLPVPERDPLAFFVAAVYLVPADEDRDQWPKPGEARIFTLERTTSEGVLEAIDKPGVLCEWTAALNHHNYDIMVPPTRSAFIAAVDEVLREHTSPPITTVPTVPDIGREA